MIALYILGVIVLLLLFFCLSRIYVYFSLDNVVSLKVRFLFWTVNILPSRKEKKDNSQQTEKTENSKNGNGIFGPKGVFSSLSELFAVAKMLFGKVVWIVGKITIHNLYGRFTISCEDAADTGVEYGAVCSLVYPAIGFIGSKTDISKTDILVTADFDSKESTVVFNGEISLRVFYALCAAISALIQYIKIKISNNSNSAIKKG